MLSVGKPPHVNDTLAAALEDLGRLLANQVVHPQRERIVGVLAALGPVREAFAVGRKRRQSVLGGIGRTFSGMFFGRCFGTKLDIGVFYWHYIVVAIHAHRGSLARDALRLRTFRIAAVDVRVG